MSPNFILEHVKHYEATGRLFAVENSVDDCCYKWHIKVTLMAIGSGCIFYYFHLFVTFAVCCVSV